jgi:hypothetical protein
MIDPLTTLRATDYGSWAHTHVPNIERETVGDVTAVTRASSCAAVKIGQFTSHVVHERAGAGRARAGGGAPLGGVVLAPARRASVSWGWTIQLRVGWARSLRRCQVAIVWVQKLTVR